MFRARVVAPDPQTARTHAPSFVGVARPSAWPRCQCPCVARAGPAVPARGGDSHSLRFPIWPRKPPVSRFRVGRNRETHGESLRRRFSTRPRTGIGVPVGRKSGNRGVARPRGYQHAARSSRGSASHESDVTLGRAQTPRWEPGTGARSVPVPGQIGDRSPIVLVGVCRAAAL